MNCSECNLPMKENSLGKVIEYCWFDDLIREYFQYECGSCGKIEEKNWIVSVNGDIDCQHPAECQANKIVENCSRCSVNKLYKDAWKQ